MEEEGRSVASPMGDVDSSAGHSWSTEAFTGKLNGYFEDRSTDSSRGGDESINISL